MTLSGGSPSKKTKILCVSAVEAIGLSERRAAACGRFKPMKILEDLKELFATFSIADITNPSTAEQWLTSMFMLVVAAVIGWALIKLLTGGFG